MDIRNFSIIAHIDHGKSTLADRLMEITDTVAKRAMRAQFLDSMELEREKGITIKLQPVRMSWSSKASDSESIKPDSLAKEYILNLIDTPGHVDFQYEVSRSLQAVEGALLLVDATQGVQAQTIANLHLAIEQNLEIIPVINKIDLPAADVPLVKQEIVRLLGGSIKDIMLVSAKTGEGVDLILSALIERIPAAATLTEKPLRALIFDSVYDDYKGVVAYVRIVDGVVRSGDSIVFLGSGATDRVVETGTFSPHEQKRDQLSAGEIGYIATGLKDVRQARVGDTISLKSKSATLKPLPGFQIPQAKVFAGVFPKQGDSFPRLRDAINELELNDASLYVSQEQSAALGQGFRCGFLGMLHMEIIQERLRREYDLDLVMTTPSVAYRLHLKNGRRLDVETPAQFPDPSTIDRIEERYADVVLLSPSQYIGAVFELLNNREGTLVNQEHIAGDRVQLTYSMPLRELVVDLYDHLKSVTSGYGSLSYNLTSWHNADVVKLTLLLNYEPVEALSLIVARSKAMSSGRRLVKALKEVIPKQLFTVPIQAAIGGTIIARESLSAMRKDVTAHLYGGDVTRKKKLLEKQKKGKKKMAGKGSIDIPPEAYLAVFKRT